MIKKNENISIIYGGNGRKYASKLKEVLDRAKGQEKYNFNANIVMDSILCCDVLDKVIELVDDTRMAVIFLTKDDIVHVDNKIMYRPRQNVILEIGMLLSKIGFENCIFLTDFDIRQAHDFEMPSDLIKIMPTCFDESNMEEVFDNVLVKIINNLKLVSHKNLLMNNEYTFNYSKLFSASDRVVLLRRNEKEQKSAILELWLKELSSLNEVDQMMVFILERLPMTNLFRYTEQLHSFFETSLRLIRDKINDNCSALNSAILEIIDCIIGYTETKAGYKLKKIDGITAKLKFMEYYERLAINIEELEKFPSINNIIIINACDYLALLSLIQYKINKKGKHIKTAIEYFKRCEELAKRFDDSTSLWKGYIQYNLARAYDDLCELTEGDEREDNRANAVRYANSAVTSRAGWIKEASFPVSITNSFLYEFFLARVFKYKMHQKRLEDYSEQMLESELNEIRHDFDIYFLNDKTSNALLLEIKEKLDELN